MFEFTDIKIQLANEHFSIFRKESVEKANNDYRTEKTTPAYAGGILEEIIGKYTIDRTE